MAIALVASTSAISSGASGSTSPSIDTTGADLIVVAAPWLTSGGVITVSDSKGNTWVPLTQQVGTGGFTDQLFYAVSPTVGAGHTFSATGLSAYSPIAVIAVSGADTVTPFDQESTGSGQSAGSVTPTTNGQLLVAGIGSGNSGTTATGIGGGFTLDESVDWIGGVTFGVALAHLIQTTATAANPTWSGVGDGAVIATFKAAAGGSPSATASITEAADTVSATATVPVDATAAVTEAADTITATATVPVAASASVTEVADTVAATVTVSVAATAALTEQPDTVAATATLPDVLDATAAIVEAADTVVAFATVPVDATASLTESPDVVTATAGDPSIVIRPPVTGTHSIAPRVTGTMTLAPRVTGTHTLEPI